MAEYDFEGLLNSPMFLMGMGLLGSGGNREGLIHGLKMAQAQQGLSQRRKESDHRMGLLDQEKKEKADQLANKQQFAKTALSSMVPGSGPLNSNPQPAVSLPPDAEQMAMTYPDIVAEISKASMMPTKPVAPSNASKMADEMGLTGQAKVDFIKNYAIKPVASVNVNEEPRLPTDQQIRADDMKFNAEKARAFNQELLDTGYSARSTVADLEKALDLLDNVETGPFEEVKLKAKKIASKLGMEIDIDSVSDAEHLRTLLGDQIMERVAQTKGAVSEKEMDLFTQYSANFGNTPEGNRKIIAFKKAKAERDIQVMRMVRKMDKEGKTSLEIRDAVMDYVNDPGNDLSHMLTDSKRATASMSDDDYAKRKAALGL
ncbi:MAG: hypothetical protein JAY60_18580 [Candidatus Thiodiazotropha weberae]|nr:hypothetical protein [Candidatus Thiodiazotropha weberae]